MTEIHNLRDRQRSGELADLLEIDRAKAARVGIIDRLHQQIDAEVAAAYGWPADLPPAEIVARLVALNAERAAEEKTGKVRWLRPEYQIPRFGAKGGVKRDWGRVLFRARGFPLFRLRSSQKCTIYPQRIIAACLWHDLFVSYVKSAQTCVFAPLRL